MVALFEWCWHKSQGWYILLTSTPLNTKMDCKFQKGDFSGWQSLTWRAGWGFWHLGAAFDMASSAVSKSNKSDLVCFSTRNKLYFPLAEERNKWKMFSLTPLGPGPEGLLFESRAQCCLSVAFLLSAISDIYFRAPVPTQPFFWVCNILCWFDILY